MSIPLSHETELITKIAEQIGVDTIAAPHIHYNRKNDILEAILKNLEEGSQKLINITYNELLGLVTTGTLQELAFYRITDYVATTTQAESRSAGHQFDIIVQALSTTTLNHKASAIQHEGDTYFETQNLAAWQIWYDINNDTSRYFWADPINGKGVIYRMIDEHNNDLSYDFKGIQFKRYKITNTNSIVDISFLIHNNSYYETTKVSNSNYTFDGEDYRWYYTFNKSENTATDSSLMRGGVPTVCNIILPNISGAIPYSIRRLNNNVFFANANNNIIGGNSNGNTLINSRHNHIYGEFRSNIIKSMNYNAIANNAINNISPDFQRNNIGSEFKNNVLGIFNDNNVRSRVFNNNLAAVYNSNISSIFQYMSSTIKFSCFNSLNAPDNNNSYYGPIPFSIAANDFPSIYVTLFYSNSVLYATWKDGIKDIYKRYNDITKLWETLTSE